MVHTLTICPIWIYLQGDNDSLWNKKLFHFPKCYTVYKCLIWTNYLSEAVWSLCVYCSSQHDTLLRHFLLPTYWHEVHLHFVCGLWFSADITGDRGQSQQRHSGRCQRFLTVFRTDGVMSQRREGGGGFQFTLSHLSRLQSVFVSVSLMRTDLHRDTSGL